MVEKEPSMADRRGGTPGCRNSCAKKKNVWPQSKPLKKPPLREALPKRKAERGAISR
jgi:hypothetical protein